MWDLLGDSGFGKVKMVLFLGYLSGVIGFNLMF